LRLKIFDAINSAELVDQLFFQLGVCDQLALAWVLTQKHK
jgi:hypothetical protein